MSDYIIEVSQNQPYYIEVDNSDVQEIVNLTIEKNNDVIVEVSTSDTFLTLEMASGYPIEATSGDLPYTRVDGLASYIQSFIPSPSIISIDGGSP